MNPPELPRQTTYWLTYTTKKKTHTQRITAANHPDAADQAHKALKGIAMQTATLTIGTPGGPEIATFHDQQGTAEPIDIYTGDILDELTDLTQAEALTKLAKALNILETYQQASNARWAIISNFNLELTPLQTELIVEALAVSHSISQDDLGEDGTLEDLVREWAGYTNPDAPDLMEYAIDNGLQHVKSHHLSEIIDIMLDSRNVPPGLKFR